MTAAAHATFAPSAMARTVACPGSVSMQSRYPQHEETPEQREGTAAHWVANAIREGRAPAVGSMTPNGEIVTQDMVDFGINWVAEIIMWPDLSTEERVTIPHVHPDNWGTCDAKSYDPVAETLRLGEYKFGHKFVDAFECWQLIDYALGFLADIRGENITIEFVVYQPRNYHKDGPWRRWRIAAKDLRPYYERIFNAVQLAASANPPCVVNPLCDDCAARHACGVLQQAAYDRIAFAGTAHAVDLEPAALGRELKALQAAAEMIAARVTGLEAQALATIRSGSAVPGYTLKQGEGREKWKLPEQEIIAAGAMMGVNLQAAAKALTPAQAREALKRAKQPAALLDSLSERPRGELKLVADDLTQARKVFSK